MAARPCHESDVIDKLEVNPIVAKAFWKEFGTHMESAKFDPVKAIESVAEKAGLKPATVGKILTADKRLFAITRDASLKRAKATQLKRAAQDLVDQANESRSTAAIRYTWDGLRRSATFGHGGVFPFTHARNLLYAGPAEARMFGESVRDAYSYMTPNTGKARWVRDMDAMQLRGSYKSARSAGLDIQPESEPTGILTKGMKGWSKRGFDALKPLRLKLWERYSDQIPELLRDEVSAKALANEINIATGGLTRGTVAAGVAQRAAPFSFAPKLFLSRRIEALTPIRHLAKGGRMTAGERAASNVALKRWAKIVTITAGTLGANDALNRLLGGTPVNWYDFQHPGSLWRYNVAGQIIPTSPLVEVIRTPVAALGALVRNRKELRGERPLDTAWNILTKDVLNAVHPTIPAAVELVTGREQFGVPGKERRLPFPGVKQLLRGEDKEKVPAMGLPEYLLEKGPIPISAFTREFVQSLQDEGVPQGEATKWVRALFASGMDAIMSGGLGLHAHPEAKPKPEPTPHGTISQQIKARKAAATRARKKAQQEP
jgi:hypothetical protein